MNKYIEGIIAIDLTIIGIALIILVAYLGKLIYEIIKEI